MEHEDGWFFYQWTISMKFFAFLVARFCVKCFQKPDIVDLLIRESKININKDCEINKYIEICSRGNISLFNSVNNKHKIFEECSHNVLLTLPLHIKAIIEIVTSSEKIDEQMLLLEWCIGDRFKYKNGEFFENKNNIDIPINRELFTVNIIKAKHIICGVLINLMNSIKDNNIKVETDINLYLQICDIINKLKTAMKVFVKRELIEIFIEKISDKVEINYENPIGQKFIDDTLEFVKDDKFYGINDQELLQLSEQWLLKNPSYNLRSYKSDILNIFKNFVDIYKTWNSIKEDGVIKYLGIRRKMI